MLKVKTGSGIAGVALCLLAVVPSAGAQSVPPQKPISKGTRPVISGREEVPVDPNVEVKARAAAELHRKGQSLQAQGKLKEAAALYREVMTLDRLLGSACIALADVYMEMGELDQAVNTYRAVVVSPGTKDGKLLQYSDNDARVLKFALALYRTGDTRGALEAYHHGLDCFARPDMVKLAVDLPRFVTSDGTALSSLYTPKRLEAIIRLGLSIASDWDALSYKERMVQVEKAVTLWPTSAAAYFYRAELSVNHLYSPLPSPEAKAKADWERAISLNSHLVKAAADKRLKRL